MVRIGKVIRFEVWTFVFCDSFLTYDSFSIVLVSGMPECLLLHLLLGSETWFRLQVCGQAIVEAVKRERASQARPLGEIPWFWQQ